MRSGVSKQKETIYKGSKGKGRQLHLLPSPQPPQVGVDRAEPLPAAQRLPQHFCLCVGFHAAAPLQPPPRPGALQGQGVDAAEEVPTDREGWQLTTAEV